jgi:hypothetical protein
LISLRITLQKQLNRCMREFSSDRFLIVELKKGNCRDGHQTRLTKAFFRAVLDRGLYVCGRHYQFALLSASQTRENKATFFAGDAEQVDIRAFLSNVQLRESMGDFSCITNPAKLASRWGQVWSSTCKTCCDIFLTSKILRGFT